MKFILLFIFSFLIFENSFSQVNFSGEIVWTKLSEGVSIAEFDAPEKSFLNDSKITIVKVNPTKCEFGLYSASEYGKKLRTAERWADEFGLNIVFNAGMFSLKDYKTSKGYMKNFKHINNAKLNTAYNSMMVFNPKNKSDLPFRIADLKCESWENVKYKYNSYAQSLRMIDCNGKALSWDKNPDQKCSMLVLATDSANNVLIIFNRSPYTQNKMIEFMLALPLNIKQATYLEGGPETSVYVSYDNFCLEKIGSYVTRFFERDDNNTFGKIPNVIGIKIKE